MQVKQLLLKLKAFGLDITALQEADKTILQSIEDLKKQLGDLDVSEQISGEIAKALHEFSKIVTDGDEALRTEIQEVAASLADHTHEADKIIESDEKQFVSAEKKAQYDENTIFTTDMLTVNGLGGIAAGENLNDLPVQQLLTKLLFPYVAPQLSASSNPNGGTFEKGDNQTVTEITARITKKSEKITKLEFLDGSNVLEVVEDSTIENGGTFKHTANLTVDTNKNFKVRITDAKGKAVEAGTGSFTFVYPYYFGKVAADKTTLTEDDIKSMTKKVEGKGNKSHSYTVNNERMVIAYPKAHGGLKSVIDPNGFDNTGAFAQSVISITGLDGTAQEYYVYVNGATTNTDFVMKFNY